MTITASTMVNMESVARSHSTSAPETLKPLSKTNQADRESQQKTGELTNKENTAKPLSRQDVEEMVEALDVLTQTLQTKLNFSINEGTNDIVVKVLDKETDKVIKQFPPEELLELQEKMQDLTGFLFSADA